MDSEFKRRYLLDPCGTLATAFWKDKLFPKPEGMEILHERDLVKAEGTANERTRYFRLIHRLEECRESVLPSGYAFRNVDLPCEAGLVTDFINRCYDGYTQTAENVLKWVEYPVFDSGLWVFIWDEVEDSPAALGIADFDGDIGEGSLEWIQVLPCYRGKGLGRTVVRELLFRLKGRADFVTVSGEVDNSTNPKGLYRKCGFTGDDIWVISRVEV